jgi:hypothetical protein
MAAPFDVDTCQAAPRRSWVGDLCRIPVDRLTRDAIAKLKDCGLACEALATKKCLHAMACRHHEALIE